jgi:hypothetical protein
MAGQQDDVGVFAGFQSAHGVGPPQEFGGVDRGHLQDPQWGQPGRRQLVELLM